MEDEDIDMDTVHDSQAFIHHHLNLLERPSTPGETAAIAMATHVTRSALNALSRLPVRRQRASVRGAAPAVHARHAAPQLHQGERLVIVQARRRARPPPSPPPPRAQEEEEETQTQAQTQAQARKQGQGEGARQGRLARLQQQPGQRPLSALAVAVGLVR